MSILFDKSDDDCLDPISLIERGLPTDLLIRKLAAIGHHVDEIVLSRSEYDALLEQLGSKFTGAVYSPFGLTKIKVVRATESSHGGEESGTSTGH